MTRNQLLAIAASLGVGVLASGVYVALSQPDAPTLAHGDRGVLVCPERISEGEMRDDIKTSPVAQRALRKRQRYGLVGRVVQCDSPDAGFCDVENGELKFEKPPKGREVVRQSGCRLEACAGHGRACQNKKRLFVAEPPCAVPNCWKGDAGEWVDDATADCQRRAPNLEGVIETRWAGCNVMPKEQAIGTECVPVSCEVFAGEGAESL